MSSRRHGNKHWSEQASSIKPNLAKPIDKPQTNNPGSKQIMHRRITAFDYLRVTMIVLVLLHHSMLAYVSFLDFDDDPVDNVHPVIDDDKWDGFDIIIILNDTFVMPMLFLISGLFVWPSYDRKGARLFLRDRFIRLGIPFAVCVPLLVPLAYYPAQLMIRYMGYGEFWYWMMRAGLGTTGHLWFIWLLLLFNCIIVLVYQVFPDLESIVARIGKRIFNHPGRFYLFMMGLSTLLYLPMVIYLGPFYWRGLSTFQVQMGRFLVYLSYFFVGSAIGMYGIRNTMFTTHGKLAGNWMPWLVFGFILGVLFYWLWFTIACAAIVLGIIGLYLSGPMRRNFLMESLSRNAYGMYIFHFVIVTWLQYMFLGTAFTPVFKVTIVFFGTFFMSWGGTAALRKITGIDRVL